VLLLFLLKEKRLENMSKQVFDKATLENEIIANKDKARERRRSIERMMLEERMLNQRIEYVEGVVEKS
jgi:hypothetical protein